MRVYQMDRLEFRIIQDLPVKEGDEEPAGLIYVREISLVKLIGDHTEVYIGTHLLEEGVLFPHRLQPLRTARIGCAVKTGEA